MDRNRKWELRELNAKAWQGDRDVFTVNDTLDSSLKKNTAFIKRLRTAITGPTLSTFIQEIRTLSLHKYLSEVISGAYEGLCRLKTPTDIAAGVEIISALHQRFGPSDFTAYLGWHLGRGLCSSDRAQLKLLAQDVREREEKDRLSRQRVLLRVATELWLVGVLRTLDEVVRPEEAVKGKENMRNGEKVAKNKVDIGHGPDADPFPLEVLKDMLGSDREHVNLPLAVSFVKAFSWDILGVQPSATLGRRNPNDDADAGIGERGDGAVNAEDTDAPPDDPSLIMPNLQQRFKGVLDRYLEDVKSHIIKDQKSLAAQGRRNAEAYVKSGEVFEDRQASYERQLKAQEKLISNAQVLADALGAEMPDLRVKDTSSAAIDGSIGLVKAGDYLRSQGEGSGIWEDEDERRFYESLIDLKDRVPGILLEDPKKKKADGNEPVAKKGDANAVVESTEEATSSPDASQGADGTSVGADEQSTAIINKTVGAQVDALLARLPELTSKEMVDQTAMDFCFLNSRASRNRLIKALQDVPKGRADLLPLYSRLIATLGKYLTDISQSLVSYLDDEFRSLQRRKQKDALGPVRTVNVRYIAELTKFGVIPEHVIFHCFKTSLDDFSRVNIEVICQLLENCGRYLLRNPESSPRMTSLLETLQRKKSAQHLGQQERMLIENALYYVNPPPRASIQQKERTPMDQFIRKLIYLDLSKRNLDKIVKQIRKLHWEEPEVVGILHKIFVKPGKIKHSNIHLLAIMLGGLHRYHQDFSISVIDDLLEAITTGLEVNDFKYNQRRVAEVKYLGELYVYRILDSSVIFDTLYKIVTFGHEGGIPKPGVLCELDLPDDFFRIRLVCNILETCGSYYEKGAAKKKLDFFLTFFQYYIHTKDPLPMDYEFMVQDAYAWTRPQWKLAANLEEAGKAFAEAVKVNYKNVGTERIAEADPAEEESGSDEVADEELLLPEGEEDHSSNEEPESSANGEEPNGASFGSEDEHIVVTRPGEEHDPEAEAEFDRELAKMMAESAESRKFDRRPMFDVPLPMRRGPRDASIPADESEGESPAGQNTTKFALLSRRGNRQLTRSIELPSDSTFAVAMRTQQEAEKAEQQRIKNLVLNYDLRDENEGVDGITDPLSPSLQPNLNRKHYISGINAYQGFEPTQQPPAATPGHRSVAVARGDKAGSNRRFERARRLHLSDVDWYAQRHSNSTKSQAAPQQGDTTSDKENHVVEAAVHEQQRRKQRLAG